MAFLKGIFKKSSEGQKVPRGFQYLEITDVERLSPDTVKVTFDAPEDGSFAFKAGQYINVSLEINGNEERRSYSICSGKGEGLSIAVKEVEDGKVSKWFNREAQNGMKILVSKPEGRFTKPESAKNCVAIAAGSGITPIVALAKEVEELSGTMRLFYGNRTEEDILFRSVLDGLKHTSPVYYLSREEKEPFEYGRITKESFTAEIKKDLSILRSDAFFICGPESMIIDVSETLKMFGVPEEKIHFELFTTPTVNKLEKLDAEPAYSGTAQVTVVIDGEEESFELPAGKSILERALEEGLDAPYSCRGGVCSTCKAKLTEGTASMQINYSLTDKEVEEGYVLTCQAHATSEKLVVNYDQA